MGRYRKLPSGMTALPLDYTAEREAFYQALVGRSLPEINSYWARLVFSGRGSPPRQVDSAGELLDIVVRNRGAIGYLPENKVDDRVVVLSSLAGPSGSASP